MFTKFKGALRAVIECCAVCCGVLLIIHRRVFSAVLTGSPMPEAPAWHKKCFKFINWKK